MIPLVPVFVLSLLSLQISLLVSRVPVNSRLQRALSVATLAGAMLFPGARGWIPIQYQHEDLAIRITEEAVSWIEAQEGAQPVFLYFAHRNPHRPWKPHPRFAGKSEAGVYGDFVQEFDWSVGEVLAAVDKKGFADDTLVIVTSDNGAGNYRPNVRRLEIQGHLANGELRGQKTSFTKAVIASRSLRGGPPRFRLAASVMRSSRSPIF